jgi:hypothetical protein
MSVPLTRLRDVTTQNNTIKVFTGVNISRSVYYDRFVSYSQLRRLLNYSTVRVGRVGNCERLPGKDQMEANVAYFHVFDYSLLSGGTEEN